MKTFVNILFGIFAGITIASYLLTRNQTAPQPGPAQAAQIIPVKPEVLAGVTPAFHCVWVQVGW